MSVRLIIKMPEVMRRTGNGKAWIYRLISQVRFPRSVKVGARAIAFLESEVDKWISRCIEERDALISTKPQL
ncbi:helix-turn-helix transcriptional regulator [Serratia surfactantfaciens]|uniref:helix-turn-helix transcriptional regulator n=1 Tax=Serratia surfactantfaciens TaxID=2741499 RepID=UPI001B3C4EDE|nr:AlpA family transcriptional regulator [Serratia surfactantfaciens]